MSAEPQHQNDIPLRYKLQVPNVAFPMLFRLATTPTTIDEFTDALMAFVQQQEPNALPSDKDVAVLVRDPEFGEFVKLMELPQLAGARELAVSIVEPPPPPMTQYQVSQEDGSIIDVAIIGDLPTDLADLSAAIVKSFGETIGSSATLMPADVELLAYSEDFSEYLKVTDAVQLLETRRLRIVLLKSFESKEETAAKAEIKVRRQMTQTILTSAPKVTLNSSTVLSAAKELPRDRQLMLLIMAMADTKATFNANRLEPENPMIRPYEAPVAAAAPEKKAPAEPAKRTSPPRKNSPPPRRTSTPERKGLGDMTVMKRPLPLYSRARLLVIINDIERAEPAHKTDVMDEWEKDGATDLRRCDVLLSECIRERWIHVSRGTRPGAGPKLSVKLAQTPVGVYKACLNDNPVKLSLIIRTWMRQGAPKDREDREHLIEEALSEGILTEATRHRAPSADTRPPRRR